MKKALLLTIVFTLWVTMAFAQSGIISIYADVGGTDCNMVDTNNPNNFFLVHTVTPGSAAIAFMAVLPSCYPGLFISDAKPFPVTVGGSQVAS